MYTIILSYIDECGRDTIGVVGKFETEKEAENYIDNHWKLLKQIIIDRTGLEEDEFRMLPDVYPIFE